MAALPWIPDGLTAMDACALLDRAGWRRIGVGDWAWVYADPDDALAARVVPFDPAYRMFAQDCLDGPANRFLPRVEAVVPLARDGHITVMERLWPADETRANAFCAALGIGNDGGDEPATGVFEEAGDPDLALLAMRIRALLAQGAARYAVWGGSDIRAGNVMADSSGALKLVDPVFIAGRKVFAAIEAGDRAMLRGFTRGQVEDFLSIAVFAPGGPGHDSRDSLLERVAAIFAHESGSPIQRGIIRRECGGPR